jgi:putative endonuclease
MKRWFVYLIRARDDSLYTGITTDVERRFLEHQSGAPRGSKSLRGKGPLTLEYSFSVATRSIASQYEYAIKRWPKPKKERLIHEGVLSVCPELRR